MFHARSFLRFARLGGHPLYDLVCRDWLGRWRGTRASRGIQEGQDTAGRGMIVGGDCPKPDSTEFKVRLESSKPTECLNNEPYHTCHLRHEGLNDGASAKAPCFEVKTCRKFVSRILGDQHGNSFAGYVFKGNLSKMRLNGEGSSKIFDDDLRVPIRELSSSDMAFRMPRVFEADGEVIYQKSRLCISCQEATSFVPLGGEKNPTSRQPLERTQSYLHGTLQC